MAGPGDRYLRSWRGFPTFCAEQLKIVDKEKKLVSFRLNHAQRRIVLAERLARKIGVRPWFIILKSRKHGVTTVEQALNYWWVWREPHQFALTLAHTDDSTRIIFHMVDLFYQYQPEQYRHRKTTAAAHWVQFPDWDGEYRAVTGGAEFAGRGATPSRIHVSEVAYIAGLRTLHQGLGESLADGGAYVFESTPNGTDGVGAPFYDFWVTAERPFREQLGNEWWRRPLREQMWVAARGGAGAFVPIFLPWHMDPRNRLPLVEPDELGSLSAEEKELKERFGLTLEQVKWWRAKRLQLMADGRSADAVHEEHPSDPDECWRLSGSGYFDGDTLALAEKRCRPPIRVEDNGRLKVWEDPKPGDWYVFGVDPAEGVGADSSAVVGFNGRTLRQAITWTSNRVPLNDFAVRVLPELGRRWCNPATGEPAYLVVERANHGHAVLALLLRDAQYPADRVYHHIEHTVDRATQAKRAGWPHDHVQLTVEVARMVREGSPLILDIDVVRSIRQVKVKQHGGADFGGRDLAVAAGLGAIGIPYAVITPAILMIGDQIVDVSRLQEKESRRDKVVRTLDDLLRGPTE
jgi:hypothetical protein